MHSPLPAREASIHPSSSIFGLTHTQTSAVPSLKSSSDPCLPALLWHSHFQSKGVQNGKSSTYRARYRIQFLDFVFKFDYFSFPVFGKKNLSSRELDSKIVVWQKILAILAIKRGGVRGLNRPHMVAKRKKGEKKGDEEKR